MLSRKVVTRRGRRIRGYFPSHKLGRMVAWESLIERDVILLLEFSRGVSFYQEQPALIRYADAKRIRDYYPDFEVLFDDGGIIHLEVKSGAELRKPAIAKKYRAIAADYARRKHGFRIVTDDDIRIEPLISNLGTLAYLSGKSSKLGVSRETWLDKVGCLETSYAAAEASLGRACLLWMLANGMADADLRQALAGETRVTVDLGGACHATYLF